MRGFTIFEFYYRYNNRHKLCEYATYQLLNNVMGPSSFQFHSFLFLNPPNVLSFFDYLFPMCCFPPIALRCLFLFNSKYHFLVPLWTWKYVTPLHCTISACGWRDCSKRRWGEALHTSWENVFQLKAFPMYFSEFHDVIKINGWRVLPLKLISAIIIYLSLI